MTITLDSNDRQLITLLREDGRATAATLSRHLDLPERTIRHRIRRLREAGVIHIVGIVDPVAIGLSIIADASIEVRQGSIHKIARILADNPWISYIALPIAGGNLINVQIRCRSHEQLGQFLNEEIPSIPDVQNISYQILHRIIKDVHNWDVPPEVQE